MNVAHILDYKWFNAAGSFSVIDVHLENRSSCWNPSRQVLPVCKIHFGTVRGDTLKPVHWKLEMIRKISTVSEHDMHRLHAFGTLFIVELSFEFVKIIWKKFNPTPVPKGQFYFMPDLPMEL